jgi:hypothetical protein
MTQTESTTRAIAGSGPTGTVRAVLAGPRQASAPLNL